MSEHLGHELGDYAEGRVTRDRAREIEEHLVTCPACAADVAWVRKLADEGLEHGLKHIGPERLVVLAADGPEALTSSEQAHLASCASCTAELRWAENVPSAERMIAELGRDERGGSTNGGTRWPRLLLWGAPLAAAAALAVFLVLPRDGGPDVASLARIEPLPVRITRGTVEPGSFEESRLLGLNAYSAADYEGARAHLRRAAELQPDNAEVALYLGSIALVLEEWPAAIALLKQSADFADNDRLREEAAWQLANAHLASGNIAEARTALEAVVSFGLRHRAEAAETLRQLTSSRRR